MSAADVTSLIETIGLLIDAGFRKFWWISWISIFRSTPLSRLTYSHGHKLCLAHSDVVSNNQLFTRPSTVPRDVLQFGNVPNFAKKQVQHLDTLLSDLVVCQRLHVLRRSARNPRYIAHTTATCHNPRPALHSSGLTSLLYHDGVLTNKTLPSITHDG